VNGGERHDERQDNGTNIWGNLGESEINEKKKPKR
jgi:hypothetical protein